MSEQKIEKTLRLLRRDVLRPRYRGLFERAQARHEALAQFDNVAEVLKAMRGVGQLPLEQRDAVLRAFITEHRRTNHAFWSGVMMVLFEAMLLQLRYGVWPDDAERHDLDQQVIECFLLQLRKISLRSRGPVMAKYLKLRTRAAVFKLQQRQRQEKQSCEEVLKTMPHVLVATDKHYRPECHGASGFADAAKELVGDAAPPDFDVVLSSLLSDSSLRMQVRYYLGDSAKDEQLYEQAYGRVKWRQNRAVEILRDAFEDTCEPGCMPRCFDLRQPCCDVGELSVQGPCGRSFVDQKGRQ